MTNPTLFRASQANTVLRVVLAESERSHSRGASDKRLKQPQSTPIGGWSPTKKATAICGGEETSPNQTVSDFGRGQKMGGPGMGPLTARARAMLQATPSWHV